MRDIFFALIFLGAIPVGLLSAHLAIAYWYFVSYFQPHTQVWSFGKSLPYGPAAAAIALLSWLLYRGKKFPPPTGIVVLLVLLAAWVTFTTFITAQFPDAAYRKWDVTIKTLLMVFLSLAIVRTKEHLHLIIWAICIGVGYYGFKLGLFSLRGGLGASFSGPSYMDENNGLARGMILTIPLLIYLFFQYKHPFVRAGLLGVALSSAMALVFSGSRGGWVAALAAVTFMGLRVRRGLFLVVVLFAVGIAIIPLLPSHLIERFATIAEMDSDGSFQGRVEAWKYGLKFFTQKPLWGGGFGIFERAHGRASHNSYIQMLGEHGAIGLMIFASLIITCFLVAHRIRRLAKYRRELLWASRLALAMQVILIGYSVGSLTINHAVFPLWFAIVAVLGSLQIVVQTELKIAAGGSQPAAANGDHRGTLSSEPARKIHPVVHPRG